jgi:peptide/nickel transport system substrate-binding protein
MLSKKQSRLILLVFLSLALLLSTVRCGATPTVAPQPTTAPTAAAEATAAPPVAPRGGTLTGATAVDAVSLQPLLTFDVYSGWYWSLIYDSLLGNDTNTQEVVGRMAESYSISDDGLTLTVKLRRNMLWSDGVPITAADFTFTWDKMMDEKVKYPYRQQLVDTFTSLTAADDFTLAFTLKGSPCTALNSANFTPIPKHVFQNLDINNNEFNSRPTVFSGPFKLQEWVKDDHVTFVANDLYYRGRPNLDKYIIRVVPNTSVLTALFQTGEIDMVNPQPGDWEMIKALPHTQAFEFEPAGSVWQYMGFNLDHPFFKDVRVRQALSYALDRKSIIDKVMLGAVKAQYSFLEQASWAYTVDAERYDYNPAKAKALLAEAGWTPGADGILVKDGKPFRIRISYAASMKVREQIATVAQQNFRDVGVAVELQGQEGNALLDRVNRTRDLDMWIMGWSTTTDPADSINGLFTTIPGGNLFRYTNTTVDRLAGEATSVKGCKREDRKKIYVELQEIIAQDAPCIFLFTSSTTSRVAVTDRIVFGPLARFGFAYAVEKWYSKTGK